MPDSKILTTGSFVLLMCILVIVESATDIYVPSLPRLVDEFATSQKAVTLTVSAYFFAFCLLAPIYGPLSDALGRKKILLLGLSLFTVCSLLCVCAPTIGMFTLLRFLQGAGAAVGWVIGLAIIKDTTDTEKSVSMLSTMHSVVALAPAIAPIVGGYVGSLWHWRATFGILAIGGGILCCLAAWKLKETLAPSRRSSLAIGPILEKYLHLLGNKKFMGCALISGLLFTGLMINVAMTPFYYVNRLGVHPSHFGYYQAALVGVYMAGAYMNRMSIGFVSSSRLLSWGIYGCFLGGGCLVGCAHFLPKSPAMMTLAMSIYAFGAGIAFANTSNKALSVLPEARGSSAGLLSVVEMFCCAVGVWFAGIVYDDTYVNVAVCILGCVVGSLWIWRRLAPVSVICKVTQESS